MYRPTRRTLAVFEKLKELNIWDVVEKLFKKYRNKWNGPDIPIYIFPMNTSGMFTDRAETKKSGVSFKDKVFLFIMPLRDEKEWEALFVHEYHHVCRLNNQKVKLAEYTLLDSIILEGLAENAVEEYCGVKYRAKWCSYYSSQEISRHWNRFIKSNLDSKKNSKFHEDILFGRNKYPPMIGYAAGYETISLYKKKHNLSLADSFYLPSNRFMIEIELEDSL